MWINGRPVTTNDPVPVRLPFDGSEVATVFRAGRADVDAAVEAAAAAFPVMRALTRDERSLILRRASEALLARKDEIARAVMNECGKPVREARIEVDRASNTLAFSSEEAHRLTGEVIPMDASPAGKGKWAMTVREPLGVIAAITPFNFPLNLAMHKIGPALAAGNTVVHKPASATPISGLLVARIFEQCGLPAGALNVITGSGGSIGDALVFHPKVNMITFTGSAEVGLRIRNLAGLRRVTLELGNNSGVIIEDDADLNEAVPRCVTGSFAHSGQVCISVQRIYVHQRVYDEFVDRIVLATRNLAIGHPSEDSTDISSLISIPEAERVEELIAEATRAGARLLTGGSRRRATIEPAVLAGVPPHVQLNCREAFGPVVGINRYETLDQAVGQLNASDYGLQAGIYTRDLEKAFRTAQQVHVGGFMINDVPQYRVDQMPYGGVKLSGAGREGPKYAIEEMTEPKLICWKV
jgi:acyl-CoA reductase-like NAD-dependent aldehyde dehydrogenase